MKKQMIEISVPDGYDAIAVRRVERGDTWMDASMSGGVCSHPECQYLPDGPRVILREIEPEIRTGWINVYPISHDDQFHSTRKDADQEAAPHRAACVEVKYEVPRK